MSADRYKNVGTSVWESPSGRRIRYLNRRILPQGNALPVLTVVTVTSRDRPDLVAARTLGDPLLFWRVADANDVLSPFELTDKPGKRIRVPQPQAGH